MRTVPMRPWLLLPLLLLTAFPPGPAAQTTPPPSPPSPATPSRPFQATAQPGVPATVGTRGFVAGTKDEIETGLRRELTLDGAELALVFASPVGDVVAAADEKLLILRGSLRNPEKTSNFNVGPSAAIGLRLWERYAGTGKFQFVAHYDPETRRHLGRNLKAGESARFVGVWRVPADFTDFRLGATTERATIVPWYDLRGRVGPLTSVFATADGLSVLPAATVGPGTPFDLDGLEMTVHGPTRPSRIAGAAVDPAKPVHVVTLGVANRQRALPARWGWQYLQAELVDAAGTAVAAYPGLYDEATDAGWSGDLAPGAAVRSQLLFYPPPGGFQAREFRLTMKDSGRRVTVRLRE